MICAASRRLSPEVFGVLSCTIVICAVMCFGAFGGRASMAQGLFPEALRTRAEPPQAPPIALPALPANAGANATVMTRTGSSSPLEPSPNVIAAPMPDANIRAPKDTTRKLGFGPLFSRPAEAYRGETFNAGSTIDPGLRDQRFPISGFTLKLPLN
jgi:hypothetical protein